MHDFKFNCSRIPLNNHLIVCFQELSLVRAFLYYKIVTNRKIYKLTAHKFFMGLKVYHRFMQSFYTRLVTDTLKNMNNGDTVEDEERLGKMYDALLHHQIKLLRPALEYVTALESDIERTSTLRRRGIRHETPRSIAGDISELLE